MSVPRVHIRGLGDNGDKEEIRRLFEKFGPLKNVWIATKPPGFAYVFFQSFKDAEKAVDHFNGKEVCGVTVSVQLSLVEDRNQRWDRERLRRDRSLEAKRERAERMSDGSCTNESDSEKYYSSDPDAKHDYERERRHEGEYRHHRSSGGGQFRENSSYQSRGRPQNYYRGRGRGYYTPYQDRGDNRRHSFPERRGGYGRGRGWSDSRDRYNDGGYRPRGRGGRPDYGESSRSRGRGRGGSLERFHNTYTPRYHNRGGFVPRDGRRYHGNEQYSSQRGRVYKESPYHHRSRSDSGRCLSPPPAARHHHEYGSHKHTREPLDSEYVAKLYKQTKNGRETSRDLGESSRAGDRRHSDIEYRQNRKPREKEMYMQSSKDYGAEEIGYDRHSSRREHHGADKRSSHHLGKRHTMDDGYYRKKEYTGSKQWESVAVHDPPSPSEDHYYDRYQSHRSKRKYSNLSREESHSRSRSRSVSSQSSDTSRGPSASPSPPRHKHSHLNYRSPSKSMSRSPSPGAYGGQYSPRRSSQHNLMATPRSPRYPLAPSGSYYKENTGYDSPLYSSSSPTFKATSPGYMISSPKRGKFEDEHFIDDKMIEYEPMKQQSDYKRVKREVRNRDRQVVVDEKYSKDRYVEVDTREVRHVSHPLSESFELVGSAHSSKHSSPQEQRPSIDLKRRHSAHKEYGMSRRHVQKSSPMSERMMKGH